MGSSLWIPRRIQAGRKIKVMLAVQVLLQLGWASGARRWIDFQNKITKVGNLLSQMLHRRWAVQSWR